MAARARKPGRELASRFYAEALSEAERADLPVALEIEGVDEEIALLRLRLRKALEEHPEKHELMFKGIELLTRMVAARYRLPKRERRELGEQLENLRQELVEMLAKARPDG